MKGRFFLAGSSLASAVGVELEPSPGALLGSITVASTVTSTEATAAGTDSSCATTSAHRMASATTDSAAPVGGVLDSCGSAGSGIGGGLEGIGEPLRL